MKFKAWIVTALVATFLAAPRSFAADNIANPKGEKTVGLSAGFITVNHSALAAVDFTYRFSQHFRLAPSVQAVFRNDNRDAFMVNINAHFPIALSSEVEIYPLAGLNYSNWSYYNPQTDSHDVSARENRFGLNVGVGAGFNVSHTLRLGIAAEYIVIKRTNGLAALASIAYRF